MNLERHCFRLLREYIQVQQDLLTDLQFLVEDCMGHEDQQNLPKGKKACHEDNC